MEWTIIGNEAIKELSGHVLHVFPRRSAGLRVEREPEVSFRK